MLRPHHIAVGVGILAVVVAAGFLLSVPTAVGHAALVVFVLLVALLTAHRWRTAMVWRRRADVACELGGEILWESTVRGRILFVSPSVTETLGYLPKDLVGREVAELAHPSERRALADRYAAGAETATGWTRARVQYVTKDGTPVMGESSGKPFFGTGGSVRGFTGVTRLVDDSRVQAQRTQQRSRVLGVLAADGLLTVAQPIISLETERVVGVEMLSRFRSEERLTPDAWFRDAQDAGLLEELELFAVDHALAAAAELPEELYVSINVSPATLASPQLLHAIETSGIDPGRIVLELTEHEPIAEYARLQAAIQRLRDHGIRSAVDDAGAGYASFRHILRLSPDFIKLDRAIVNDIHADAGLRALTAAIVMFALEVNASIVAEGVENADELKILATLGIDAAQGYLIQRPTADRGIWRQWSAA